MSRIFVVLVVTAGILHAEGPSDSSVPNSVYRLIFDKAFSDEQLIFDENEVLRIMKEMDALKSAGLDTKVPLRAVGKDSTKMILAFKNAGAMLYLMDAGIDWVVVMSLKDIWMKNSKSPSSTLLSVQDRAISMFLNGLNAAGFSTDALRKGKSDFPVENLIKNIGAILERARALAQAGLSPESAYKAEGISLDSIPVPDRDKYYDMLSGEDEDSPFSLFPAQRLIGSTDWDQI